MAKNIEYAKKLLDSLIEYDKRTQAAYYEMGRILYSLRQGKLYDILGYDSMSHMVEEELSFTSGTAFSYIGLYREFARLNYHKLEAINMLQQFGMKHMYKVLPKLKTKIGVRAMKKRGDDIDEKQLTIWLHEKEYNEVAEALEMVGGMRDDTGRWKNSSEAILELARAVNKKGGKKTPLKVAAK